MTTGQEASRKTRPRTPGRGVPLALLVPALLGLAFLLVPLLALLLRAPFIVVVALAAAGGGGPAKVKLNPATGGPYPVERVEGHVIVRIADRRLADPIVRIPMQ